MKLRTRLKIAASGGLSLFLFASPPAVAFNPIGKQDQRSPDEIRRQIREREKKKPQIRKESYRGHLQAREMTPPEGYERYTVRDFYWGDQFDDYANADPRFRSPYDLVARLESFYTEKTVTEVIRFGLKLNADPGAPPSSRKIRKPRKTLKAWILEHDRYYRAAADEIFSKVYAALNFTRGTYIGRESKSPEFLAQMYANPRHGHTIITVREREPTSGEGGEVISAMRVASNFYKSEDYLGKWEVRRRPWSSKIKKPKRTPKAGPDDFLRTFPENPAAIILELPYVPLPLVFGENGERKLLEREISAWDPSYSIASAKLNLVPLESHFRRLLSRPTENGMGVIQEPGMWGVRRDRNLEGFAETWMMMIREFTEAALIMPGAVNHSIAFQADDAASKLYEKMGFIRLNAGPLIPPEDLTKPPEKQSRWWIMSCTLESAKMIIENLEDVRRGVKTENADRYRKILKSLIALDRSRADKSAS